MGRENRGAGAINRINFLVGLLFGLSAGGPLAKLASWTLTFALLCLCARAATGQSLGPPDRVIGDLQRSLSLVNAAKDYFQDEAHRVLFGPKRAPNSDDLAENFRKMREGESLAGGIPGPMRAEMLWTLSLSFNDQPTSILGAVDDYERKGNVLGAGRLANLMAAVLSDAIENLQTEEALGPIDDAAFYGTISPPTTWVEILRNLKFAAERHATLRDDLYTPENMRRLFGVSATSHRYRDGSIRTGWVVVRGRPQAPMTPQSVALMAGCTVDIQKIATPAEPTSYAWGLWLREEFALKHDVQGRASMRALAYKSSLGTPRGQILIMCGRGPRFEEMEEGLGSPSRVFTLAKPDHHARPPAPSTSPHGYANALYGDVRTMTMAYFGLDGRLETISLHDRR